MRIKDNLSTPKSEFSEIRHLTEIIANKTLEELEEEGTFVFPETVSDVEDISGDQFILKSVNDDYWTGNVMGFIGLENERLVIGSRFDSDGNDFFSAVYAAESDGLPKFRQSRDRCQSRQPSVQSADFIVSVLSQSSHEKRNL